MKLGIMQPYFLPYIGYWQLLNWVDKFVIYDNIEFEKAGWMRRNRILINGKDKMFTLPVKKDSDYLNVNQRFLADNVGSEIDKILKWIKVSYSKAPYINNIYPLLEEIFKFKEKNLFSYIYNSVIVIAEYIGIHTEIIISSTVQIDHSLKGKYKVMEICKKLNANEYINPIGGINLYDKLEFGNNGITLKFLESALPVYRQDTEWFVPGLSIIDVLMYNSKDEITKMLNEFNMK